jgi:outer membrane receptor for ferrienterochelin and colicin
VTTELITADDFRKSGAVTVDKALDSHIGVDNSDDLSGRGISLRGVDPSRVLVLVDGKPGNRRVRGSLDLGRCPLAMSYKSK